jgi:hypothetical protein
VRKKQIIELLTLAEENSSATVITAGDFNTAPYGDDGMLYEKLKGLGKDLTGYYREKECKECDFGTHLLEIDIRGKRGRKDGDGRLGSEWADSRYFLSLIRSHDTDCPYSDHHGLDLRIAFVPPS